MSWYFLVLKKYCVLSGRARRKEYWYFMLFYGLSIFITVLLDLGLGTFKPQFSMGWISGVYLLATALPVWGVSVRRLHDIGRSGWWLLLNLLPGLGPLVLTVTALFNSQPGINLYGPNPKEQGDDSASKSALAKAVTVVGAVLTAMLVTAGAGYYWFSNHGDEFLAIGKAHRAAGLQAGRTLDERGCVSRAIDRLAGDAGHDFAAGIANSVDLSSCLEASQANADFCEDVPHRTDILAAGRWVAETCDQVGYAGNTSCSSLIQSIPEYCESDHRADKTTTGGAKAT